MIEKLDNNEQVLLMYLCGELPPEDCTEVRRMLEADASLRQDLARLGQIQESINGQLAALDEASPLAASPASVALRVGKEIRQRLVRSTVQSPAPLERQQRRSWRWVLPAAAAASVALATGLWIHNHLLTPSRPLPQPQQQAMDDQELLVWSLSPDQDREQLAMSSPREDIDAPPADDLSQALLTSLRSKDSQTQ